MNTTQLKDHRQIGQELELFFVHEYAPGAIFWLPKGWIIYQELVNFIRDRIKSEGYLEISTPVMIKSILFKNSGHWEHFGKDNMFNLSIFDNEELIEIYKLVEEKIKKEFKESKKDITVTVEHKGEKLEVQIGGVRYGGTNLYIDKPSLPVNYSLKPMNCPEAALVFAHKTRSYKDLPLRLSEFGILHRRELSGVLGGLLRVRQFVIDDAHLFVRKDQILGEILKLLNLVVDFYKSLDFEPKFYLATKPDKAMGAEATWGEAEKDLEEALKQAKVKYDIKEKDGAFYGPKIDTHIKDSQGRDWQLATIQLDFMIPEGLKLEYVDSEGKKVRPVMIHRGIFGSVERFIGMLIEHFQGSFPVWLAPVQAVVIPIAERNNQYAKKVADTLIHGSIRIEVDDRSETMQARVRDAELQKVPYIVVVGDKEEKSNSLSVRTRGKEDIREKIADKFILEISQAIANRTSVLI